MYKLATWLRAGETTGWTILTALSSLTYPYFEWLLWRKFGAAIQAHQFDVVCRLIPLSPTAPSLLARRCAQAGVPFVLGPLNGGVPWPRAFNSARHQENEWLSYVRGLYKLIPGYRATRDFASAIIVGSRATLELEPQRYHHKCVYIPENGFDPARFTRHRTRASELPLKVVFVGRLVPYKGADMLLEACAPLIRASQIHLTIIGEGPQRTILEGMIQTFALSDGVTLTGWVDHQQLQQLLVSQDVFAFPSIREFGGAVILEAMALGLVPAVVDYGGPSELVTPETGFLIPMGSREQIIARFNALMQRLVAQPAQIDVRAALAAQRARLLFSWDVKAAQMLEVFKWVAGQAPAPRFNCPLSAADARPPAS
jgi:glycosyltransferase involved in cell wall biosynthesis